MQIAVLLFDRVTALDAVGPYQVLARLPHADVVFVGERLGPVRSDDGQLGLVVDATLDQVATPDVVVVPGGPGQRDHMADGPVPRWLRAVDQHTTWTTSVCTGSLILAGAGLLTGRRATTHWLTLEQLIPWGVTPTPERVVIDGKYATATGVSAGIDMALTWPAASPTTPSPNESNSPSSTTRNRPTRPDHRTPRPRTSSRPCEPASGACPATSQHTRGRSTPVVKPPAANRQRPTPRTSGKPQPTTIGP